MEYSFERYLRSKATIDDRSLNHDVREIVRARVTKHRGPLSVLEIGGGVGTMVDRMIGWGMLRDCRYTIVDIDAEFMPAIEQSRERWAEHGVDVRAERAAIEDWLKGPHVPEFDLIIAHAVLDVVNSESVISSTMAHLSANGLLWLTINFDGDTIFVPDHPHDGPITGAYHESMDRRMRDGLSSGDSKAGRRLFQQLRHVGADILAAGSSDWVVYARGGRYHADEAYFLHHILHFFEQELGDHPVLSQKVHDWLVARRSQIESSELVYVAHQLDFVAQATSNS